MVVLDANRWHASAGSCIACDMTVNSARCEFVIIYRLKYNFLIKQHAERLTDVCVCGSKIEVLVTGKLADFVTRM